MENEREEAEWKLVGQGGGGGGGRSKDGPKLRVDHHNKREGHHHEDKQAGGGGGSGGFAYKQATKTQQRRRRPKHDDDLLQPHNPLSADEEFADMGRQIAGSEFFNEVVERLAEAIGEGGSEEALDIVCYGLGHIGSARQAKYQFGLLLLLHQRFAKGGNMHVYDPAFTAQEEETVRRHGANLITCNEEGRRVVHAKTLFYMPHCDKYLYNNVLEANWGATGLSHLLFFGNSFSLYHEQLLPNSERQENIFLESIGPFMAERRIEKGFEPYKQAFNDQSIIHFPRHLLSQLPSAPLPPLRPSPAATTKTRNKNRKRKKANNTTTPSSPSSSS